ncbi:MAG TPA: hypothetical protein VN764_02935 [Polyangiaceae bacterium]|nr:hypothetical protein [Polyangiaceae bacterium]
MTSEQLIETLTSIGLTPRATSAKGTPHPNVVGVEVHRPVDAIYDLCRALVEADKAHLIPQLSGFAWDSLGSDQVIYWPHLPWPGEKAIERARAQRQLELPSQRQLDFPINK